MVVFKPVTQALFGEVFLVQVVGEIEHATEEKAADLDGGFTDAALEMFAALEDEHAQARVAAQEQGCRGRSGEGAAENDDVPRGGGRVC